MINITALIDERDVLLLDHPSSKNEVIEELVDHLNRRGVLSDARQCLEDVLAHEQAMATGLANGIAIPHARTSGTKAPHLAVAQLSHAVAWETLDGSEVRSAILIVVPHDGSTTHLEILSRLAESLMEEETCARLCSAQEASVVLRILEGTL